MQQIEQLGSSLCSIFFLFPPKELVEISVPAWLLVTAPYNIV